tara:strand:+ start:1274 stop:1738 length:465 start_codon:yes stop_codon:yes gene_type:complete
LKYHYTWIYLLLIALGISFALGYVPLLIPIFYFLLSVMAFIAYKNDKQAAIKGTWRVPEKTLHLLALIGGWPGAIFAQQRLRHKTQKMSFKILFWLTLGLNLTLLAWLHTKPGQMLLRGIFEFINRLLKVVFTETRTLDVIDIFTHFYNGVQFS